MPATFRSHCRSCQAQELYSLGALVQKLQEIQLFRRQDPNELLDPQLALEVAKSAKEKLRCSDCQQAGLTFRIASDDADDEAAWQGTRPCSNCGQPIPPERLEVFPDSTVCMKCARQEERGTQAELDEFCPRCGNRMQVRGGTKVGVARYALICPSCRR